MGWFIAGAVVVAALVVIWTVKAIVLLARLILLVGVMLLRVLAGMFR